MTSPPTPAADPAQLQALLQETLALHQQGRLAEARAGYERILALQPHHADALHLLGVATLQGGDAATAVTLIDQAIALCPTNPEFHLNQAIALRAQGRLEAALDCHDRALVLNPDLLNGHLGRAALQKALGRLDAAATSYERALALRPDLAEAHYNLGNLQLDLQRPEAAAASYERALALKPEFAQAQVNRGNALLQLSRHDAALACLDTALMLNPGLFEAHVIRGNILEAQQQLDAAITSYDHALALKPDHAEALRNRGKAQLRLTRIAAAVASLEAAVALAPDDADAHLNLGNALAKLHRNDAALAAFDRALALDPGNADAWHKKGALLFQLNRMEEAATSLQESVRLVPRNAFVLGGLHNTCMYLCDWHDYSARLERLGAAISRAELSLLPFAAQSVLGQPALQQQVAHSYAAAMQWPATLPGEFARRTPGDKIRLGYFSADFREHPVARLTAGLFEHHDRSAFEVIGFAFGPPTRDGMRQRLEKAFDRLIDVSHLSDPDIARLAREQGIDIAIDLGGYTQDSRSGIFSCRAAPVQVSYIGFIGTMGVPWMDYLIADANLIPPGQRKYYDEKIACLPWHQANSNERRASDRVFSRAELGLPATGVVLACFNNHYKITPEVFERWMHILAAVPDSVLLLLVGPETARRHLREAAEAQGVSADRLVFAGRLTPADYLARYRVADLFLDTWPCNAGATASDAISMGVPVLTCRGEAMVSRMAASVLEALQMPELITTSPAEYERRAVELARDHAQLAALHRKVEQQCLQAPLFDIARFTRYLEAAFRAMHARRMAGQAPDDIVIAP